MLKQSIMSVAVYLLFTSTSYTMDSADVCSVSSVLSLSLQDQSAQAIAHTIHDQYRSQLTAGKVCQAYDELHASIFSRMPPLLSQQVKKYCCIKYGCLQSPYDRQTVELEDKQILAIACEGPICALSGTKAIYLLDVEQMKIDKLHDVEEEGDKAYSVVLSPECGLMAVGLAKGIVRFWDLIKKACYQTESKHNKMITSVAFSPDSKLVASGSLDTTICLWDAFTGKHVGQVLKWHDKPVQGVCFCSDEQLVSCTDDGSIYIGTVKSELPQKSIARIPSLCFLQGKKFFTSDNKKIHLWDAKTGIQVGLVPNKQCTHVFSMSLSPDGNVLAACIWDNSIKLWNMLSGKLIKTLRIDSTFNSPMDTVDCIGMELLAFSDNFLVSADKLTRIWKLDSFEQLWIKIAVAQSLMRGDINGLKLLLGMLKTEAGDDKPVEDYEDKPRLIKTLDSPFQKFIHDYIIRRLKL